MEYRIRIATALISLSKHANGILSKLLGDLGVLISSKHILPPLNHVPQELQ